MSVAMTTGVLPPPTEDELYGRRLYGNDFDVEQRARWFEDERDAYAGLGASVRSAYRYAYHALNERHGFRHLGTRRFAHAVGLGSAHGDEFEPIVDRIDELTIVEPSSALRQTTLATRVTYVEPQASGELPLPSGSCDLVVCLGVLHHIANVELSVREIARIMKPGAVALVREPTHSMGDWCSPRRGLTRHERGIPLDILRRFVVDAGLGVVAETRCMFSLMPYIGHVLGVWPYGSPRLVRLDGWLSRAFSWNWTYHATRFHQRFRPTSVHFVLGKGEAAG